MATHKKALATKDIKLPVSVYFKFLETEKKAGNTIVSEKTKKNGSRVVIFKDGAKIVFNKTGALSRKFADGSKVRYSPKGTRRVVRLWPVRARAHTHTHAQHSMTIAPWSCVNHVQVRGRTRRRVASARAKATSKTSTHSTQASNPEELFTLQIENAKKNGNGIVSDKTTSEGIRKVVFEDGGKLHLHKTGVMIRKFPDGKKVQCNSDGKQTTVCSRHAYHWGLCRLVLTLRTLFISDRGRRNSH